MNRKNLPVLVAALVFTLTPLVAQPQVFAQEQQSIETLRSLGKAFASIADKASPAVVAVKSEREVTVTSPFEGFDPFRDDFFDFFNRRWAPEQRQPQRRQRQTAKGSGFVVSADGYIMTNNHVVQDAVGVEVVMLDERRFKAEVVGTDPESDLAILKIDADNLPYLQFADSDKLEVGEWVLAIGNPFGLSHTVTAGIISATGRTGVGISTYEDFIQTDAAINFGNSGGPLITLNGKVVGINSAIVGRGGNIGIGFAIPINMAKNVYAQIKETGEVVRGFLGVLPQDVTADMAEMFDLEEGKGVIIAEVTPGSAADKAGLRHNDVVLQLNGRTVTSASEFRNMVAAYPPGEEIRLNIWRDGDTKTVEVTLDKRPSRQELLGRETGDVPETGLIVQNLTDELAAQLGYEDETGVLVTQVEPGSPAGRANMTPGMLIKEVNRRPVANVSQFQETMRRAKGKGKALLLVKNRDYNFYAVLNFED